MDAVAHPLNILALLDMAARSATNEVLAAAVRHALAELSQVNEHHGSLPAEAASALTNAIKALQRALV